MVVERHLDRRDHQLLHDLQQQIVAGHLEAVAEALLRRDIDVGTLAVVEDVVGNDEVGGAATNVDGRKGHPLAARLAIRLRHSRPADRLEEVLRPAGEVLLAFAEQVDHLGAGGLIPFCVDARKLRPCQLPAGLIQPQVLVVPAERLPDEGHCLLHAAGKDVTLRLRH